MAYLTHSAYRDHRSTSPFEITKIGRFAGAALVALVAVASVAAVSSGAFIATPNAAATSAKGDRLASAVGSADVDAAGRMDGVQRDESRQTTTVARGASVPFSASSPYLSDKR